jgi:hypothetical protein
LACNPIFTLTNPAHLDEAFLHKLFQEVGDWVYEQTGLVLPPEARKFEVYTNPRGGTSAEGRVGYRGPLARAGDAPRIKLDLTDHERLVLPIDRRSKAFMSRPTALKKSLQRKCVRWPSVCGPGICMTWCTCTGAKS